MGIQRLKRRFRMTIHELIAMMKLKGIVCESGIIGLLNDKYVEWAMILFEDEYYVAHSVLDNYEDICYYEDIEDFENELQARVYCLNLPTELNGEVYE